MAHGRAAREWDHTAALLAAIFNANPYRRGSVRPDNFHPYPNPATRAPGQPGAIASIAAGK